MIIAIIFTVLFVYFNNRFHKKGTHIPGIRLFFNRYLILTLLLVWIAIGYVFKLDYNNLFGCCIGPEPNLLYYKVYSGISFSLILLCFLIRFRYIQLALLTIECIYWLLKLFIIKGGYAVGFAGVPIISVVLYDFIGILIRFHNLRLHLKINITSNKVVIISLITFVFKLFFPCPKEIFLDRYVFKIEMDNFKNKLKGKWEGTYTHYLQEEIENSIDTNSIEFKNLNDYLHKMDSIDDLKRPKYLQIKDTLKLNIDLNTILINSTIQTNSMQYKIEYISPYEVRLIRIENKHSSNEKVDFKSPNLIVWIDTLIMRRSSELKDSILLISFRNYHDLRLKKIE